MQQRRCIVCDDRIDFKQKSLDNIMLCSEYDHGNLQQSCCIMDVRRRRALRVEVKLCVEAWEQTPHIHAEELARRLVRRFPAAVVDWERGDAHIQAGLERLVGLGAPGVILESHRSYFGNVVFVSVSEPGWSGATATSHLHTIMPPLGDAVFFDVEGAADETAAASIGRQLGEALGMVLCSELPVGE